MTCTGTIRVGAALLVASLSLGAATRTEAETGYELWMRYVRVEDEAQRSGYRKVASGIVLEDASPTGRIVRAELRRGLSGLLGAEVPVSKTVRADGAIVVGTAAGSPLIARLGWAEPLARLGPEGYLIRSTRIGGHAVTVIASEGAAGALYGTFHFLRLMQTRQPITGLDVAERPRIAQPPLDHWANLDGP